MTEEKKQVYDIIILGAGPGGCELANRLAEEGKRVVLVDRQPVGGCCVHTGCIPMKTLYQERNRGKQVEHRMLQWTEIQEEIQDHVISSQEGMFWVLASRGVKVLQGEAEILSARQIRAGQQVYEADILVLATGSAPVVPVVFQACYEKKQSVYTTEEFWTLEQLPERLTIIGGGVIGCEMASALKDMVKELVIIEAGEQILSGFDARQQKLVRKHLEAGSATIYTGNQVVQIAEDAKTLFLTDGTEVQTDGILLATGRKPALPLEKIPVSGIAMTKQGFIQADAIGRTSVENVYCIGDANGQCLLAQYAKHQARKLAHFLLQGQEDPEDDIACMPQVAFTDPPLARVGLSVQEASDVGYQVKEGVAPFYALGMGKILHQTDGYLSLVRDVERDRILGAQIAGPDSYELIHTLQTYLQFQIPCAEITRQIFAHPTMSEAIAIALDDSYGGSMELPRPRKGSRKSRRQK